MRIKTTFLLALLCAIAQGAWAYDQEVSINSGNVTVPGGQHWLVTGSGKTELYTITLGDGATVTLSNVDIDSDEQNLGKAAISCQGSATVILADGTDNRLYGDDNCSALQAGPEGSTLTIQGASTGTLRANGGRCAAAIGGRNNSGNCGNIVIQGGTITAIGGGTAGNGAAGIGGDIGGNCGNITINGGNITAIGGYGIGGNYVSGAAIGAGGEKGCGNITIAGGIIDAKGYGYGNAVAIGASKNGKCGAIIINGVCVVKATKGNDAIGCIGRSDASSTCSGVSINGVIYWDGSAYLNGGASYLQQETFVFGNINKAPVTVPAGTKAIIKGLNEATSNKIVLGDGADVLLSGVNISTVGYCIKCEGDATVTLKDGSVNTLNSTHNIETWGAALWAGPENKTLTIQGETLGTGSLTAQGSHSCAGIGANNTDICGNIVITGGVITARGGFQAAGIGGGSRKTCQSITITGGIIDAAGGKDVGSGFSGAAGIGYGYDSRCYDITITNGVKRLTATKGDGAAWCIGTIGYAGVWEGSQLVVNDIVYSDGSTAYRDFELFKRDKITLASLTQGSINGDQTEMKADETWIIMGDGNATSNQIWIADGATVCLSKVNISNEAFAVCCLGDADVILMEDTENTLTSTGAGYSYTYPALWVGDAGNTLRLYGKGSLTAQGGYNGAGIGGGTFNANRTCGDIIIDGGIINVTGGFGCPAIGCDYDYKCGNITITGNVQSLRAIRGAEAVHCIGQSSSYSRPGTVSIDGLSYWNGSSYVNGGENYLNQNEFRFEQLGDEDAVALSGISTMYKGDGTPKSGRITVNNGAIATLDGVNISNEWCVKCEGAATVILKDKTMNTLTATDYYPALWVGNKEDGCSLTLKGKGALKATGGNQHVAIGSARNTGKTCGDITILGGIIDARGGTNAAAIGSSYDASCGNVTISEGVTYLVAKRGTDAIYDCIGNSNYGSNCGTVTINGVQYWNGTSYVNDGSNYLRNNGGLALLKTNAGDNAGEYWATFYYDASNFQAPEGTKVFKAALDDTSLTLSSISDRVVNSNQGVILKSTSANILMPACSYSSATGSYDGNSLTGTMTTIANPGNAYVLNKGSQGIGFYKLSATGVIAAGKAYLTYDGSSSSARAFFRFDDITGVGEVSGFKSQIPGDDVWYTIDGRKLYGKPTVKGIYIVNGKAVSIN